MPPGNISNSAFAYVTHKPSILEAQPAGKQVTQDILQEKTLWYIQLNLRAMHGNLLNTYGNISFNDELSCG
jgi:hypothetical protein